jgi:hypothetical protein
MYKIFYRFMSNRYTEKKNLMFWKLKLILHFSFYHNFIEFDVEGDKYFHELQPEVFSSGRWFIACYLNSMSRHSFSVFSSLGFTS